MDNEGKEGYRYYDESKDPTLPIKIWSPTDNPTKPDNKMVCLVSHLYLKHLVNLTL